MEVLTLQNRVSVLSAGTQGTSLRLQANLLEQQEWMIDLLQIDGLTLF
jgi:hypothetical protein